MTRELQARYNTTITTVTERDGHFYVGSTEVTWDSTAKCFIDRPARKVETVKEYVPTDRVITGTQPNSVRRAASQWRDTTSRVLSYAKYGHAGTGIVQDPDTGKFVVGEIDSSRGGHYYGVTRVFYNSADDTWRPLRHQEEDTALSQCDVKPVRTVRLVGPRGGWSAHQVVETVDGTFAYKADGSSTVVKEVVEDMDAATILALYSGTATVGNNDHDVFVYEVESHIMGETRHPRWATGQWHANDTVDEGRNSWHTYVLPITGQDEVDSDQAITEFLAYAAEHMDETFHVPHFKGWDKQRGVLAFARATDNVKLPKSWAKMIALIKSL